MAEKANQPENESPVARELSANELDQVQGGADAEPQDAFLKDDPLKKARQSGFASDGGLGTTRVIDEDTTKDKI